MNYFQVFSIIWGILMIGVRLLMHIIPESWNRFELDTVYKDKKPKWVWIIAGISVLIIGFTWYKELTTQIRFSLIVTILATLTLVKMSQLVFNYQNFRNFVKKALVEDRSIIVKINTSTTILGIILVLLGFLVF